MPQEGLASMDVRLDDDAVHRSQLLHNSKHAVFSL